MTVCYNKLWKLLIDKNMKRRICAWLQVFLPLLLPSWARMSMLAQRSLLRFVKRWTAISAILSSW